MIGPDDIVVVYEMILSISQQMLSAAEQRDWQNLESLEALYSQQIENLKACSATSSLSPECNTKVEQLLSEIITFNQKLFDITKPWLDELALKVSSVDTEQKLQQAYHNINNY